MSHKTRQFLPTLADLIDALTIDQIKEIKLSKNKDSYSKELGKISHDIEFILEEKKNPKITAKIIRLVTTIAQINVYIWNNKDQLQEKPDQYDKLLKMAHQLNGIRNRMKNLLLEEFGDKEPSLKRTNIETDDLKGWNIDPK